MYFFGFFLVAIDPSIGIFATDEELEDEDVSDNFEYVESPDPQSMIGAIDVSVATMAKEQRLQTSLHSWICAIFLMTCLMHGQTPLTHFSVILRKDLLKVN